MFGEKMVQKRRPDKHVPNVSSEYSGKAKADAFASLGREWSTAGCVWLTFKSAMGRPSAGIAFST